MDIILFLLNGFMIVKRLKEAICGVFYAILRGRVDFYV